MASSSSAPAAAAWITPRRSPPAQGCASLIEFTPLAVHHIPIPPDWAFLVAHSLHTAEKSGAVRERYNAVRTAGTHALPQSASPRTPRPSSACQDELRALAEPLDPLMRDTFLHVVTEAQRVRDAVEALRANQPARFGRTPARFPRQPARSPRASVVPRSIASSTPPWPPAPSARGSPAPVSAAAPSSSAPAPISPQVRDGLIERFYSGRPSHIIDAEPGRGAVNS